MYPNLSPPETKPTMPEWINESSPRAKELPPATCWLEQAFRDLKALEARDDKSPPEGKDGV